MLYLTFAICLILVCLAFSLYYVFQILFHVKEKNRLNEDLLQQLSQQVFQSFDSLKSALHDVEKSTQSSLIDSVEKSGYQSTKLIIDQQNRNHQV